MQFVNDPGIADEVVVIHVDGRPIDRQSAIALTKAALKDQKRQAKGKKGRNAVDQIIADLSEPQRSVRSSKKKGGFSWRNWALAGCVGWIALVIAAGVPLGILLTPLVGPLFGWMAAGMLSIVFDDRW